MNQPLSVVATFNPVFARITTKLFQSIIDAYNAAVQNDLIEARAVTLTGDLKFNRGISFRIKGGLDSGFNPIPNGKTVIKGKVTIVNGKLVAEHMTIR